MRYFSSLSLSHTHTHTLSFILSISLSFPPLSRYISSSSPAFAALPSSGRVFLWSRSHLQFPGIGRPCNTSGRERNLSSQSKLGFSSKISPLSLPFLFLRFNSCFLLHKLSISLLLSLTAFSLFSLRSFSKNFGFLICFFLARSPFLWMGRFRTELRKREIQP